MKEGVRSYSLPLASSLLETTHHLLEKKSHLAPKNGKTPPYITVSNRLTNHHLSPLATPSNKPITKLFPT
jgi:hypothetical protein